MIKLPHFCFFSSPRFFKITIIAPDSLPQQIYTRQIDNTPAEGRAKSHRPNASEELQLSALLSLVLPGPSWSFERHGDHVVTLWS